MDHDAYPDAYIRSILADVKTIALVGVTDSPVRASYIVTRYLLAKGYRVYPINPDIDGEIDGMKILDSLDKVPEHIDIVNVFRRPMFLPGVVDDALRVGAGAVWVQLGLSNPEAAQKAEAANLTYVEDRCIKIDYYRFIR